MIMNPILDKDNAKEVEDVEMVDVEEGELVEAGEGETSVPGVAKQNQESGNVYENKNKKKKKNRKNRKRNGGGGGSLEGIDVNRFVINVCSRLGERKSYLMYTAVGCLGISALNDLVNEVYAIQACGGQKISGGTRPRTGGGILWNILKTRDPNVFKEIMKKGREFEKQFKHQSIKREPDPPTAGQSSDLKSDMLEESEKSKAEENDNDELSKFTGGQKRASVHNRLRVPVSYSDLLDEDNLGNERVPEGENLHGETLVSSPSAI